MAQTPSVPDDDDNKTNAVVFGGDLDAFRELDALASTNNDELTPQTVLERARDERSFLHPYFDWDDSSAAEKYRLSQARGLISRYYIRVIDGHEPKQIRYYTSVHKGHGERSYQRTGEVMTIADVRSRQAKELVRQLNRIMGELAYWEGTDDIVSLIGQATEKIRKDYGTG